MYKKLQPNMNNYRCHSRFFSVNKIESYFSSTALTTHILITLFSTKFSSQLQGSIINHFLASLTYIYQIR